MLKQANIFIYIFFFPPFTYRSHISSTSFVLLRLFVQIILPPPSIHHCYSTPGINYKLLPLLFFFIQINNKKIHYGREGEGGRKDFSQTSGDSWPVLNETLSTFLYTYKPFSSVFLPPPDKDVHFHRRERITGFTRTQQWLWHRGTQPSYELLNANTENVWMQKNDYSQLNISIKVWNTTQKAKWRTCQCLPPLRRAGCPKPFCNAVHSLTELCFETLSVHNVCALITCVLPAIMLVKDYKHTWLCLTYRGLRESKERKSQFNSVHVENKRTSFHMHCLTLPFGLC